MQEDSFLNRQERMNNILPLNKIKEAKICVLGAGAIGASLLPLLINTGYQKICYVDFDRLEKSNFARTSMVYRFPEDYGRYKVEAIAERGNEAMIDGGLCFGLNIDVFELGPMFFGQFDAVVSCVDDSKCRCYINQCTRQVGVPFFESGTNALYASIRAFDHKGCCYNCDEPYHEQQRLSCSMQYYQDINANRTPTCQISSTMSATLLAYEITKAICNYYPCYNINQIYNGTTGELHSIKIRQRKDCPVCSYSYLMDKIKYIEGSIVKTTYRQLEQKLEKELDDKVIIYWPDGEDFVIYDFCEVCGKKKMVLQPYRKVREKDIICEECIGKSRKKEYRELRTGNQIYSLDQRPEYDEILDMTLKELGYSYGCIIRCTTHSGDFEYFAFREEIENLLPPEFFD